MQLVNSISSCQATFSISNPLPSTATIFITIPDDFSLPTTLSFSGLSPYTVINTGQITYTQTPGTKIFDLTNFLISYANNTSQYAINIQNLTLPQSSKPTASFIIQTYNNDGYLVDQITSGMTFTAIADTLSNISLTASLTAAGTTSTFTVGFNTKNFLPSTATIRIKFPSAMSIFTTSTLCTASGSTMVNATPTCTPSVNTNEVIVSNILTASLAGNSRISINIPNIKLPPSTETTSAFIISTRLDSSAYDVDYDETGVYTASPGIMTSGNLTCNPNTVAALTTGQISFSILNPIPIGGSIVVTFPSDGSILIANSASAEACTVAISNVNYSLTCTVNTSVSPSLVIAPIPLTLTTAIASGTSIVVFLSGLRNPSSQSPTSSFKIQTYQPASDYYLIDQLTSGLVLAANYLTPANLNSVLISLGNNSNGFITNYTFNINPSLSYIPSNVLNVIFDSSINLAAAIITCQGTSVLSGNLGCIINGNIVSFMFGTSVTASQPFQFVVVNVKNPSVAQTYSGFQVTTQISSSSNYQIEQKTSGISINTIPATITTANISLSLYDLSTPANYTFNITPINIYPSNGKIILIAPSQIGVPSTITCTLGQGLSGTPSCLVSAGIITITNIVITPNSPLTWKISTLINPPTQTTTDSFQIQVQTSLGAIIDQLTSGLPLTPQCNSMCASCQSNLPNVCIKCFTGFLISALDSSCVNSCPSGTYNNSLICGKCDVTCKTCSNSSTNCTSCGSSTPNLEISSQTCLANCNPGSYSDTMNTCQPCISPCILCTGVQSCTSCVNSLFLKNTSCVTSCGDGYFQDSIQCTSCSKICATCSSATTCLTCNISSQNPYFYSNSCLSTCPNDSPLIVNATCVACQIANCAICDNSTKVCVSCSAGFYLLAGACVKSCPEATDYTNNTCIAAPAVVVAQNVTVAVAAVNPYNGYYAIYIPFPFLILTIFTTIFVLLTRVRHHETFALGNIISLVSLIEFASWVAMIFLIYLTHPNDNLSSEYHLLITAGAFLFYVLQNIMFFFVMFKTIRPDPKFYEWRKTSKKNMTVYVITKIITTVISFKFIRIMYSRLFNSERFSAKFQDPKKLAHVLHVFSFIQFVFCILPIMLACTMTINWDGKWLQTLEISIEVLLITLYLLGLTIYETFKNLEPTANDNLPTSQDIYGREVVPADQILFTKNSDNHGENKKMFSFLERSLMQKLNETLSRFHQNSENDLENSLRSQTASKFSTKQSKLLDRFRRRNSLNLESEENFNGDSVESSTVAMYNSINNADTFINKKRSGNLAAGSNVLIQNDEQQVNMSNILSNSFQREPVNHASGSGFVVNHGYSQTTREAVNNNIEEKSFYAIEENAKEDDDDDVKQPRRNANYNPKFLHYYQPLNDLDSQSDISKANINTLDINKDESIIAIVNGNAKGGFSEQTSIIIGDEKLSPIKRNHANYDDSFANATDKSDMKIDTKRGNNHREGIEFKDILRPESFISSPIKNISILNTPQLSNTKKFPSMTSMYNQSMKKNYNNSLVSVILPVKNSKHNNEDSSNLTKLEQNDMQQLDRNIEKNEVQQANIIEKNEVQKQYNIDEQNELGRQAEPPLNDNEKDQGLKIEDLDDDDKHGHVVIISVDTSNNRNNNMVSEQTEEFLRGDNEETDEELILTDKSQPTMSHRNNNFMMQMNTNNDEVNNIQSVSSNNQLNNGLVNNTRSVVPNYGLNNETENSDFRNLEMINSDSVHSVDEPMYQLNEDTPSNYNALNQRFDEDFLYNNLSKNKPVKSSFYNEENQKLDNQNHSSLMRNLQSKINANDLKNTRPSNHFQKSNLPSEEKKIESIGNKSTQNDFFKKVPPRSPFEVPAYQSNSLKSRLKDTRGRSTLVGQKFENSMDRINASRENERSKTSNNVKIGINNDTNKHLEAYDLSGDQERNHEKKKKIYKKPEKKEEKRMYDLENIYLQRLEGTKKQNEQGKKKKKRYQFDESKNLENSLANNDFFGNRVTADNENDLSDFDNFANHLESMKK